MRCELWRPVSLGDPCASDDVLARIAPGLSRREVIRLAELYQLNRLLPDRPTPRDLREAVERSGHTADELGEYHRRARREAAMRRGARRAAVTCPKRLRLKP